MAAKRRQYADNSRPPLASLQTSSHAFPFSWGPFLPETMRFKHSAACDRELLSQPSYLKIQTCVSVNCAWVHIPERREHCRPLNKQKASAILRRFMLQKIQQKENFQ